MRETFAKDSPFIELDSRTKRWAIPYHYEALNCRVENLIGKQEKIINNKRILDLGCHFGTFAYACLQHDASYVQGTDTEDTLINQAYELFKNHKVDKDSYSFKNKEVISYLNKLAENEFDTVLCLGLFYYLSDPFHFLKLMKKVAKKYILLDTFTAYYGATVSKERKIIADSTTEATFQLPLVIYPLTQAKKLDYTLKNQVKLKNKRPLTMLALPTITALENFFMLLELKYKKLSWEKYVINDYTWQDFIEQKTKDNCHWADVYHTNIRVTYLLEV